MLDTTIKTSISGLQVNALKLANSASNIANSQSTSTSGGPGTYTPLDTQSVSQPGGGVRGITSFRDPATVFAQLPQNPLANDQGVVEFPNVNLDEELVTQAQAAHAYKANAVALSKAQDLGETLINALNEEA